LVAMPSLSPGAPAQIAAETEAALRAVTDHVPDLLLLLDLELRIQFSNRAIADVAREQLVGHSIIDFVPESECERVREIYTQAIAERAPKVYELRTLIRGEPRWFQKRIGPVMRDGRVAALAVACSEITARRRGEEMLRALEREITEIANREQRRIGNDLHDGLGQELTGIALMLRSLASRLQKEGHPAVSEAEELIALVNSAIDSTRSLARGLAPVSIERGGLPFALRALATHTSEMYGVRVRFHSKIWPQLTLEASGCNHLYRIAQEAICNAVKHGAASEILVQLKVAADAIALTVSDNGRGFAPGAGFSLGMGLKIMRYRANMLGGTVSFEPRLGGGAAVLAQCRQPLSPEPLRSQGYTGSRAGELR
jgi:two-component system sensor histidine kinase UhpB